MQYTKDNKTYTLTSGLFESDGAEFWGWKLTNGEESILFLDEDGWYDEYEVEAHLLSAGYKIVR